MSFKFPLQALDPTGKVRTLLVDAQGRLVTDQAAKPATTYPATSVSIRADANGRVMIV